MEKIKRAKDQKRERFGKYAKEAMQFFDGSHDFMWKGEYAKGDEGFLQKGVKGALPTFRMTVNRVFEAVALFGPVLYHRNPTIQVTPKVLPKIEPAMLGVDPQDQQSVQQAQQVIYQQDQQDFTKRNYAKLKEHYLNWLQQETDKKEQARMAINEAIIKGMSFLWTEMVQAQGSAIRKPRSVYVSVDDIVIDPDAQYWDDVQWIARRVVQPLWKVEREYGLEGRIRGNKSSANKQAEIKAKNREDSESKRKGESYDLIEYWQVYSKGGFGNRLRKGGITKDIEENFDYEQFGDFCYIAVCDDCPFPLNMPPEVLTADPQEMFMRSQWPIPFWTDGGWPFSKLHFYEKPKEVWPISLIKPAIGELRFVNWCMSFLADKVAAASTTYVAIAKAAGAEIQDQIKSGMGPYTVIEISEIFGQRVSDVVSFLDAPAFNVDIWRMVSEVLDLIDKRTGLTELLYGLSGGTQIRSATEADVRNQNVSVRPDDMASRVEDWLSHCAMKEMEAAEWSLSGQDVQPILGDVGALIWEQRIQSQEFERTVMDFDYRIEAGSARKPNKTNRVRQLNEFGQIVMPMLQQFVQMGIDQPYNSFVRDWAKANELDAEPYLINMAEIKQQEEQAQQGKPSPEEQAQQMQQQMQQQQMQMEQQKMQMEMQAKQAELDIKRQEMQMKKAESEAKQEEIRAKQRQGDESARIAATKSQIESQKIQLEQQIHIQEMRQDSEKHQQEMAQERERHQMELEFMKAKSEAERRKAQQTNDS
tara:strand:+ start:447 stop:2720 length:2274 start_codon:yes stop_codon:yes gene_type:complete